MTTTATRSRRYTARCARYQRDTLVVTGGADNGITRHYVMTRHIRPGRQRTQGGVVTDGAGPGPRRGCAASAPAASAPRP